MNQQGSTQAGQGRFAKLKKKASKALCGKAKDDGGEQQQGTELRHMSNSRTRPSRQRVNSPGLPEILDVGRLLYPARRRTTFVGSCGPGDRPEETPRLPEAWAREHDLTICNMDRCGVYLPDIVTNIKQSYPELKGPLSAAMVDKRLRKLDQQPEIDYFRSNEVANKAEAAATPFDEKENVPSGQGNLRLRRSRAGMRSSTLSLRGTALTQSGNSYPRPAERDEPTTPTHTSITAETRRRDAAIRSSRSRPHLKQD